ncbi:MAG: hypothetical protein QOF60_3244 [Actinomycetota bacterium]|nr:hypothetical protein [Actinomycetota bacterium]
MVSWLRVGAGVRSLFGGLPAGVVGLPGPGVLVGASYTASPVGPYVELALAVPARLGLRPGLCVVWQLVSSADARAAYRSNWGLPAVVGPLSWSAVGGSWTLRCEDPGIELRGSAVGGRHVVGGLPLLLPMRSLQRRADGPVVLPRRMFGLARPARTFVSVGDDPVAAALGGGGAGTGLAGPHWGMLLSSVRMTALPARHPAGFWSSLRAPLQVAEPVMSTAADPLQLPPARACSSVG